MKELVLKGIFEGVQALESFTFLKVPDETISSAGRCVATVEKMGVKIDWLHKIIGDICNRRDRFVLSRKVEQLKARLTELWEEPKKVQQVLEEVRAERSIKHLPPSSGDNDKICIIADL